MHGSLPTFGLVQECRRDGQLLSESPLSNEARVLDVVAAWERASVAAQEEEEGKGSKNVVELEFRMVFKAQLHFFYLMKEGQLSQDAQRLLYIQGVHDVIRDYFPINSDLAIYLAALQMQCEIGDAAPDDSIINRLGSYLSPKHVISFSGTATPDPSNPEVRLKLLPLISRILKEKAKFSRSSKYSLRRCYLEHLLRLPHYGASIFDDVVFIVDAKAGDWDYDRSCLKNSHDNSNLLKAPLPWKLGISEKGIIFLDAETRSLRKHHHLKHCSKSGFSSTHFYYLKGDPTVDYSNNKSQRVLVFETGSGRQLNFLFNAYKSIDHNATNFR